MVDTRLSAEQRRASIVEAALPLFASRGFDGTTTKEIAEAAEISEALLYRHFPSKEHLYQEIENACCAEKEEILKLFSELKPSTATLVHIVHFVIHTIAGHECSPDPNRQFIGRLLVHSYLGDGRFARLFFSTRLVRLAPFATASMQAAIDSGDLRPVSSSLHDSYWFAMHLAMSIALNDMPPEQPVITHESDHPDLLDLAVTHTLRGMGLSEAAIETHHDPKRLAAFFSNLWSGSPA